MHYLFDGTYAGMLCCIFESFERKEPGAVPITQALFQGEFFTESRPVITDTAKAKRVQLGLQRELGVEGARDFFRAFLSEDPVAWLAGCKIARRVFEQGAAILNNYGDEDVRYFTQTLKKVSRERHRMKAFIRFRKSNDGVYFAIVDPDFNVLPLIAGFFKDRYADQSWLIYDVKRKYGLWYDQLSVTEVRIADGEAKGLPAHTITIDQDESEAHFQALWKQYYRSTTIEARKNLKLHLQHVPRRYWKYLTEKK